MAKRILVVDDDPDQLTTVESILSEEYDVDTAQSPEEATSKLGAGKPDLILLDVMMGELDSGLTLCQKLKSDPETKDIRIIMVTGIRDELGLNFSPDTDGDFLPADDYIEKPVDPEDLLRRIHKLLR